MAVVPSSLLSLSELVRALTLLFGACLGGVVGSYSHLGLDPLALGWGGFVGGGAAGYYLAKRWVRSLSDYVEVDVPVRELDADLKEVFRRIWRDWRDR